MIPRLTDTAILFLAGAFITPVVLLVATAAIGVLVGRGLIEIWS